MKKTFFLAIAIAFSVVLDAQVNLTDDERFYSRHSDEIMQMFNEECPVLEIDTGEGQVFVYALVDFDGDGKNELWVREIIGDNGAFFCRGGDSLAIIMATWFKSFASVNGNVLCAAGPAGTGAFFSSYSVLENSAIAHYGSDLMIYNVETDTVDHECEYDGNEVSWSWFENHFHSNKFVEPHNDEWLPFERLSSDVTMDKVSGTYYHQEYGEYNYFVIDLITDGKGNAWFDAGLYSDSARLSEMRTFKWLPIENKTITFKDGDYELSIEMYGSCLYVKDLQSKSDINYSGTYYRDFTTFGDNNGNLYMYDYDMEGALLISRGPNKGKVETPDKILFEYEGREVPVVGVNEAVKK